jgi:hypothetical protein
MDTLVIYFTGLLLFAPDLTTGQMHVLAPDDGYGVPHVLQIGVFKPDDGTCDQYVGAKRARDAFGICYYDLGEWSLDLLFEGRTASQELPAGMLNLTTRFRAPVPRQRFTIHPNRGVRARVTLGAGAITNTCALANWTFGQEPNLRLINLIEWTIPAIPTGGSFVLNHINRENYEVWERRQRTIPLPAPLVNGKIPVVIRHVPWNEDTAENPEGPETAMHFAAYYDLLQVSPHGFLPHRFAGDRDRACSLGSDKFGDQFVDYLRGPRTFSCMTASALAQ